MTAASAFRLNPVLAQFVPAPVASMLAPPLELLLSLRRAEKVYAAIRPARDPAEFARRALAELAVRFEPRGALADIPESGPLVLIANHPFGGIEGLYLYTLLAARRPDVRVLGNQLLGRLPEFAPALFTVDVLAGRSAASANAAALRRAIKWVGDGGALLVFPAGEVSALDPGSRTVVDPPWHPSVARLISLAKAAVLPVYVEGVNSALFHAAGLVHPRLRTALLPRELFNKGSRVIDVQVGRLIPARQVERLAVDGRLTEHLRLRVYALAGGAQAEPGREARRPAAARRLEPIAAPVAAERLAAEVQSLDPAQRLGSNGDLEVWYAGGPRLPWVLQELGRLRELTFRAVGEGTGRPSDVDLYDSYYDQLFVWNRATREVVGGYRIGQADRIRARFGVRGLYTSTLFEYHKSLLPTLGPALELGRSFVRVEYQRSFAPLLLLWKGIGAYVVRHPQYRVLFGPVSISNDYSEASRALLAGFLMARHGDAARGRLARARHPMIETGGARVMRREAAELTTLEAVESVVASIEADGKGVPVLLRQYLKLGASVLAFNVDPAFGQSIDVLVAVDLGKTDPKVLAKYMGRDDAQRYLAAHAIRL